MFPQPPSICLRGVPLKSKQIPIDNKAGSLKSEWKFDFPLMPSRRRRRFFHQITTRPVDVNNSPPFPNVTALPASRGWRSLLSRGLLTVTVRCSLVSRDARIIITRDINYWHLYLAPPLNSITATGLYRPHPSPIIGRQAARRRERQRPAYRSDEDDSRRIRSRQLHSTFYKVNAAVRRTKEGLCAICQKCRPSIPSQTFLCLSQTHSPLFLLAYLHSKPVGTARRCAPSKVEPIKR